MRRSILFPTVLLLCLVWTACQMPGRVPLGPEEARKTPVADAVAASRQAAPPPLPSPPPPFVSLQRSCCSSGPLDHLRLPREPVNRGDLRALYG